MLLENSPTLELLEFVISSSLPVEEILSRFPGVDNLVTHLSLDEDPSSSDSQWGEDSEELLQEQQARRYRGLGLELSLPDNSQGTLVPRDNSGRSDVPDSEPGTPCESFFRRHPHIKHLHVGWNPYLLQNTLSIPAVLTSEPLISFTGTHTQLSLFSDATLSSLHTLTLDREYPYALLSSPYMRGTSRQQRVVGSF
ncbi:hypothetical protein K435DRAFT_179806 [Dendrothele bispora CBS 962.96]|uniref:Uncharacterized protein n=1 Tax=Dendrothele bispora (strain CBS 962.96) TaxID=1314807 RepID=A0A4S8LXR9_DENBC|nr:hypothetical protein K435DRAFT_179806 [Dendrothele bispora CBS 962.96]